MKVHVFFFYFSFLLFLSSFISFFETRILNAVQTQYCFSIPGVGITGGHCYNQLLMSY